MYVGDNKTVNICFLRPHLCTNGYSISLWIKSLEDKNAIQNIPKPILVSDKYVELYSAGIGIMIYGKLGAAMLVLQIKSDSKFYDPAAHLEKGHWYHAALVSNFGRHGVTGDTAYVHPYIDGCLYAVTDTKDRPGAYDEFADGVSRSLSIGYFSEFVEAAKNAYVDSGTWPASISPSLPSATHAVIDEIFMVEKELSAGQIWSLYNNAFGDN